MRIALYARVSKADQSQDPENQLRPLRAMAHSLMPEHIPYTAFKEYVDMASGGSSDRVHFLAMLKAADQRQFDLLLIWSLDRLSREGISNTLGYLERLKRAGVAVKSLQESWLDTRDEGIGQLLLAIMAWVAQQERRRILERTKAGLARAVAKGKKLGRPFGSKDSKPRRKSGYYLHHARAYGSAVLSPS